MCRVVGYPLRAESTRRSHELQVSHKLQKGRAELTWNSSDLTGPFPVRLRLYFKEIIINIGPSNVKALFENKDLSAYFLHGVVLHSCFGLSKSAKRTYLNDNSGPKKVPAPGRSVKPQNRLEFKAIKWHHDFLTGPGYPSLAARFERSFEQRLVPFVSDVRTGQMDHDDLMQLMKEDLMGPGIIDAMLGPALLQRQPSFLQHFWIVHDSTWKLVSGVPRWLASKPRVAVDRCLEAIKSWHAWARCHSDPAQALATEQDDAFWGSKYIRERQLISGTVDGFTDGDIASLDLALIWA